MERKTTINLMTPINSLGYGTAGKNIFYKLASDPTVDTTLFPIGNVEERDPRKVEVIKRGLNKQVNLGVADVGIKIWHENQLAERPPCKKFIGFPFFEIDRLPQISINNIKTCDHLFVASKYAKESILASDSSIKEDFISIVPLGVDKDIFSSSRYSPARRLDKCIFFNCGKWEVRKGHDVILKAFKSAFPKQNDVELHMMCHNPFPQAASFVASMREYYSNDWRVKLLPRVESEYDVANVMAGVDCGIFPARTEGWNLELLEMMSMGKHVIATNCTAHKEYCHSGNSMLVDVDELEPAYDGIWFNGEYKWWKIGEKQISQIADHMKSFYNKWKSNKEMVNTEGLETARTFSWDNTVSKILKEIQ